MTNLLFYFKKQTSTENLDELKLVRDFKKNVGNRGLLYWDFENRNQFERYLRQHLTNIILRRDLVRTQIPSNHSSIDLAQLTTELDAQLLVDSHTGLIYIDLDDFGRLNQELGIAKADEVLFSIVRALSALCKTEALIFHRVLGDQFAIFVNAKRSVLETARKLAMEIRKSSAFGVTASVGTVSSGGQDAESMILSARYASYLSKKDGKDRITDRSGDCRPIPAPGTLRDYDS